MYAVVNREKFISSLDSQTLIEESVVSGFYVFEHFLTQIQPIGNATLPKGLNAIKIVASPPRPGLPRCRSGCRQTVESGLALGPSPDRSWRVGDIRNTFPTYASFFILLNGRDSTGWQRWVSIPLGAASEFIS
jgi:hypothetical protein